MEISEKLKGDILNAVDMMGEAIDSTSSAGYGMTIENDANIWRVKMWTNDSMAWASTGYGKTLSKAWENCVEEDEDEELEAEWKKREEWLKRVPG